MPRPPLPAHVATLLASPNPAVMGTVGPDGRPVTVATWYLLTDDGQILLGLDATRARLEHLQRDPRVALTALAAESWYSHVSVTGTVVSIADDEGLRDIDRLARHYTGADYPVRDRPRVSVLVTIDTWHAWGAAAT